MVIWLQPDLAILGGYRDVDEDRRHREGDHSDETAQAALAFILAGTIVFTGNGEDQEKSHSNANADTARDER